MCPQSEVEFYGAAWSCDEVIEWVMLGIRKPLKRGLGMTKNGSFNRLSTSILTALDE